jgi:hypothetical protein
LWIQRPEGYGIVMSKAGHGIMEFIRFLIVATHAYRIAKKEGAHYAAFESNGVPVVACYVGIGRDAWRISQVAVAGWREPRGG